MCFSWFLGRGQRLSDPSLRGLLAPETPCLLFCRRQSSRPYRFCGRLTALALVQPASGGGDEGGGGGARRPSSLKMAGWMHAIRVKLATKEVALTNALDELQSQKRRCHVLEERLKVRKAPAVVAATVAAVLVIVVRVVVPRDSDTRITTNWLVGFDELDLVHLAFSDARRFAEQEEKGSRHRRARGTSHTGAKITELFLGNFTLGVKLQAAFRGALERRRKRLGGGQ